MKEMFDHFKWGWGVTKFANKVSDYFPKNRNRKVLEILSGEINKFTFTLIR